MRFKGVEKLWWANWTALKYHTFFFENSLNLKLVAKIMMESYLSMQNSLQLSLTSVHISNIFLFFSRFNLFCIPWALSIVVNECNKKIIKERGQLLYCSLACSTVKECTVEINAATIEWRYILSPNSVLSNDLTGTEEIVATCIIAWCK